MKKLFILSCVALVTIFAFAANKDNRVHPDQATHYIKGDFTAQMVNGKPEYKLSNVQTAGIEFAGSNYHLGTMVTERLIRERAAREKWPQSKTEYELGKVGELEFTFDSARTTFPGGFSKNDLSFWYYDKEIGEWQPDVEIHQATGSFESRKIMTIMLVLDCSTSLDKDFPKVKASAKYFLEKLYNVSNTGNVRVGIIGFSSLAETRVYSIKSLTQANFSDMIDFINKLGTANGTALYYSVDKAVTMMDEYANSLSGEDYTNYSRSCLVTFTDGIDQTSQNIEQGILNADSYYEQIKNTTMKRHIRGQKIDNYIVAVQGMDITTAAMVAKFDRVLSSITDNYIKIEQFSQLRQKFGEIADNLINSWQVLNCYVPAARQGLVCWTLGEDKPVAKKEKNVRAGDKRMLLGLSIGVGMPYSSYSGRNKVWARNSSNSDHYDYYVTTDFIGNAIGADFQASIDFAYPITQKFALGAYFSAGAGFCNVNGDARYEIDAYDRYKSSTLSYIQSGTDVIVRSRAMFKITTGILMTIGDMTNKGACIIGIGTGYSYAGNEGEWYDYTSSLSWFNEGYIGYEDVPIELRLGGVFKNGFYFTADFNVGLGTGNYDDKRGSHGMPFGEFRQKQGFYIEPSIHIGYNFGNLFTAK